MGTRGIRFWRLEILKCMVTLILRAINKSCHFWGTKLIRILTKNIEKSFDDKYW
jgi:hypothetical protein